MTRLTDDELHGVEALSAEVRHCGGADYNECDLTALANACINLIAEVRAARAAALSEEERRILRVLRDDFARGAAWRPSTSGAVGVLDKLIGDAK